MFVFLKRNSIGRRRKKRMYVLLLFQVLTSTGVEMQVFFGGLAKEKELKRLKAAQKAEAAKLKELETGVYPTRGQIYVKGHTRKNGKIVNGKVSEVVASLQAISSESSSSTQGSVSNFSNDDYSQVKGPEKRGYIRCVGRMPTIKKVASSTRNPDPAMEELKAVVGAMAKIIQENIPNSNLSAVLSKLNIKMPGSTSSAESHHNGSG